MATELNKSGGNDPNSVAQEIHSFLCPITHSLFIDPVLASDGFSYERNAIEKWFKSSENSPVTGMKISRLLFPNHALRCAVQEMYPQTIVQFEKQQTHAGSSSSTSDTTQGQDQQEAVADATEFDFSKDEIFEFTRAKFATAPAPGTVYYGIFEQQFHEGEYLAKSTWTVRMEFESLHDYAQPPVVTATIIWRKHVQSFEPNLEACNEDFRRFALQLNKSVGGRFVSKLRGPFDANTGKLEMYAYEAESVGNGFYSLLLGQNGDLLDGIFYVRDFLDPSLPSVHGRGIFRLRKYTV